MPWLDLLTEDDLDFLMRVQMKSAGTQYLSRQLFRRNSISGTSIIIEYNDSF